MFHHLTACEVFPIFSGRRLQGGKKGSHLTEFPQSAVTIDACC
jgi:hypothetical protein